MAMFVTAIDLWVRSGNEQPAFCGVRGPGAAASHSQAQRTPGRNKEEKDINSALDKIQTSAQGCVD